MKHLTLKSLLLTASAVACIDASAQTLSFAQDREFRDLIGWPSHRTVPMILDFNNDGIMDAYYGGTSCVNGWTPRGVLVKGLGNGQFESNLVPKYETYISSEPVPKKDAEGNIITDAEGNTVYETDANGDIVYQDVERQRIVGMENGLPFSIRGLGSQPIDYNQDGHVDMLLQSDGGNDTGCRHGLFLVKNKGDYTFEVVFEDFFSKLPRSEDGKSPNDGHPFGAVSIADYDKDGYPDILFADGWAPDPLTNEWGRQVRLLRNLRGEGFEDVKVFKPLPANQEYNRRYLYTKTESTVVVDEDGVEQIVPGQYTTEPTFAIKPLGSGNVVFVDLNNDGWKDIVLSGWADGDDTEPGGYEFRYYENLQDGWFQDASDKLFESAGVDNLAGLFGKWGGEDNVLLNTDWNQDGREDLLLVGTSVGHEGKQAYVLLNASTPDKVQVQEQATSLVPISGLSSRCFYYADFNGDDICDYFAWGWTDYQGRNDWAAALCESTGSVDAFAAEVMSDGVGDIRGAYISKEMTTFGDLNNDGRLDFLATGWTSKNDDVIPSYNTLDYTVEAPDAPKNVSATNDKPGTLTITWEGASLKSGGEAMYNVYVINKTTGKMRMVVPANIDTGKQLGHSRFGTYIYSGGEGQPTYVVPNLPAGDYTVGVQSVNCSYQASPFATVTVKIDEGTGIQTPDNEKLNIAVGERTLTVTGAAGTPVHVYATDGRLVGSGVANQPIMLQGRGVYTIKAGRIAAKIIK